MYLTKALLLIVLCFPVVLVYGQDTTTSDGLLLAARKAAFDEKNYSQARSYLNKALTISPGYADVRIFLGRIYTWTGVHDSAKACFEYVLSGKPDDEDAAVAYADLEYWESKYEDALRICDNGLRYHSGSPALLLRKAKILNSMRRFSAADSAVSQVLFADRGNSEARRLADRIRELSARNRVGVSYDLVCFDRQFNDPWHLAGIEYGRSTGLGTVTGRINYANRFKDNGVQYELEAYPHISRTFYSYAEAAYSGNVGVFPHWRAGFSLYANLPASFEGEAGVRYLKFSGPSTWIYTAYLGKYYKSWLFGGRVYITPGTYVQVTSLSYTLSARYYFGGADDYLGGSVNYGISPDDRYNVVQLDSKTRLTSYSTGLTFKKKVTRMNVLSASASWLNQEYLPKTNGNQYQIGVAWQHRF